MRYSCDPSYKYVLTGYGPRIGKRKHRGSRGSTTTEVAPAQRHELIGGVLGHSSGPIFGPSNVSETVALGVDTVYACCRIIADGVSSAVWSERFGNAVLPSSRIVRRPAASLTRREWLWRVAGSMALYSFCPLEATGGLDSEGVPMSLMPRSPARFRIDPEGTWRYDGEPVDKASWRLVYRTLWPTVGPTEAAVIRLARGLIAQGASMDAYAHDFWANGGAPLTILKTEQELSGTQGIDARAAYQVARQNGPSYPLVLGKGFDIEGFGVDIAQAQGTTAEARQELVAGLARYWGIPPTVVNAPTLSGSMVYQNVAELGSFMVTYTLEPYASAIADMLSEELPGDYVGGRHVTLDISGLAKPAPGARAAYYQTMTSIGAMSIEEVRDAEGLPPQEPAAATLPASEPVEVAA